MAKQTVNLGTSANKGDGDPLRTAFDKINDNFNELYAGNFADPASISSSIIPSVTNTYDLGSSTKRWSDLHVNDFIYLNGSRLEVTAGGALLIGGSPPSEVQDTIGSVFGDDSTLLVDGVNNKIVGAVDTASLTVSSTNVAIGNSAGLVGQHGFAVAIGTSAGRTKQSLKAVALGARAGANDTR